jgi:hypothetical protein
MIFVHLAAPPVLRIVGPAGCIKEFDPSKLWNKRKAAWGYHTAGCVGGYETATPVGVRSIINWQSPSN